MSNNCYFMFFNVYMKFFLNDIEIFLFLELLLFFGKLLFFFYLYIIFVVMLGKVNVWKIYIVLFKFFFEVIVDKFFFFIKSFFV